MLDKLYKIKQYRHLTPHVVQIFIQDEFLSPFIYQPGQYIKIFHPDQTLSPFSIANAPLMDGTLELHLFHSKENTKAKEMMSLVREKKELIIRGPYGKCTANHLVLDRPILFLARGTGFAPIKAIVEALSKHERYPAMHLYWAVGGWRELYLYDLVERWVQTLNNFRFTAVLTREYLPDKESYASLVQFLMLFYRIIRIYLSSRFMQVARNLWSMQRFMLFNNAGWGRGVFIQMCLMRMFNGVA